MVKKGTSKRMSGAEIESNNRRVHDKGIEKDMKMKMAAREKKLSWAEKIKDALIKKGLITEQLLSEAKKGDDKAYTVIRRLFDKKVRIERGNKA